MGDFGGLTALATSCCGQGYTEVRYDEEKKRVVSEPLQLSQAFRNFEGATSVRFFPARPSLCFVL